MVEFGFTHGFITIYDEEDGESNVVGGLKHSEINDEDTDYDPEEYDDYVGLEDDDYQSTASDDEFVEAKRNLREGEDEHAKDDHPPDEANHDELSIVNMLNLVMNQSLHTVLTMINELKGVDPEGNFDLQLERVAADATPKFKRFYMRFSGLREGFVNGCRPALMGNAEHRNCAWHIYANLKKKHRSTLFKSILWKTVKSTTTVDFEESLAEMRTISEAAYDNFTANRVEKFYRSKIRILPKCDAINNKLFECFNAYILQARSKPIINTLEYVRRAVMRRMGEKLEMIKKVDDLICPRIRKILEENKLKSGACSFIHASNHKFEVIHGASAFVVDIPAETCSCMPLNGQRMWPKVDGETVLPPTIKKQPSRPKKSRRKDKTEIEGAASKHASKKGVRMMCSICKEYGHNRKSFNKRGRPRTKVPAASTSNVQGPGGCDEQIQPLLRPKLPDHLRRQAWRIIHKYNSKSTTAPRICYTNSAIAPRTCHTKSAAAPANQLHTKSVAAPVTTK
ncbi:hypothetical protein CRG98_006874 [Punica granatum]|uniref:Uncharacterized protein n=1 Tax=Punica granatum TaxID=22663 RepID=A0A2I0KW91_PUNGR|nr:hypothetical protein CRG98_006874 [Punica granatum]